MLPGERPTGLWQPEDGAPKPPWYRFNPRIALSYLPLLIVAVVLATAVVGFSGLRRPVVLYIDNDVRTTLTYANTVARVLNAHNIALDQGDVVIPDLNTKLEANMVIIVRHAREVRVRVDGQTLSANMHTEEPLAILAEMGLSLGPSDALLVERVNGPTRAEVARYPTLADLPALPVQMRIVRATPIVVSDNGRRYAFQTSAPTVGEALLALEEPLYEGDRVEPSFGTPITPDLEITIQRALPVTIRIGDIQIETRTLETSVRGLLDELYMPLAGDDYSIPAGDTPLAAGMDVRVVRVGEEIVLEEDKLAFGTTWRPEPSLELDQHTLIREGQAGVLQREVRVRYESGVEVSRVVRSEWVAQEPLDEIRGYGTRIVIRTLQTELGEIEYWRHLRMLATSYTAATSGKEPGNSSYGITGVGLPMRHGIIAIDPRVINFFTNMYVPGYGIGLAADTGGAIKSLRIDLGYEEDALELWYDWVDVYLLLPVPNPDDIIWVLPE